MDYEYKPNFKKKLKRIIVVILLGFVMLPRIFHYFSKTEERHQEELYIERYRAIDSENYDEQMAETDIMLQRYPNNIEALTRKSYLENNIEKAILICERVLELDPKNATAYNNLCWAYSEQGLYKLALFYGEKALKYISDGNALYEYLNIGDAYQGLCEYEKAIESYENAVDAYFNYYSLNYNEQYNSKLVFAYQEQGECYLNLGMHQKALLLFEKCFKIAPDNDSVFNSLFDSYKEQAGYNEDGSVKKIDFTSLKNTVDTFVQHCDDSQKGNAYARLAFVYFENNKNWQAAEYFLLAAEASEYKADYYFQAALSYAKSGDKDSAKMYLSKAIQMDAEYKKDAEIEPLLEGLYE